VTTLEQPPAYRPRRRPPRRRAWPRVLAAAVLAALAFAVGLSVGKALEDGPAPPGTVTYVRTLEPLPQQSATGP
jgi:hypothetical protein